ncbi:unnamed protein product [Closterium sp. Naga37s-1]|nr:unnamed protein product [Closterium sp. Naga37s-1]
MPRTVPQYHPDVSQASGSGRTFQAIVAAYEVLSDDQQRHLYDLSIQRAAASSRAAGSRVAASRGATVARGASVRVAGVPAGRSSTRHWSSVSSATPAHGASASFDPFDRAFSASARASAEPGPGSARASSSECPIFSAWYLRWLFHARWALAVQQRARRVAAFKTRSSAMSRGAWRGEHEAQKHGGEERMWRRTEGDEFDWRAGDGAGQEAGRNRWKRPEQAGSNVLLEQGGLLEGNVCSSGRGGVAAAASAAATGGAGVAAAAGGGLGGVEQGATMAGENVFGGSGPLWDEPPLHHAASSPAAAAAAAAAAGSAPNFKASTVPLASYALFILSFLRHAPSSLLNILLSPLQPEWRASFGPDLIFILVSVILDQEEGREGGEGNMGEDDGSPSIAAEFEGYARVLDEINERRERLVKASRDVTIQSKKIIFAIHRATTPRALAAAAQQLASLRAHHMAQVARELQEEDYWRFTRAYTWGLQEYVEAASFLHFRQTGRLLTLAEVNGAFEGIVDRDGRTFHMHAADYVLGLADLTGEVMRLAVSSRAAAAAAGAGDGAGDGAGGVAGGVAGAAGDNEGSNRKGSSRRGKRPREQPEAQPEPRDTEPAAAAAAAAEPAKEVEEEGGAVGVDADACRLFMQRLYAGFSLLPRSSEVGKEMGKKMDVMTTEVVQLYAGFSLLPRSSEVGKKMDVMLASLNKIENGERACEGVSGEGRV